ncbi:IS66 family transposase [Enterococcus faecium]|uniref:IS66 family transposase n=1 Tax=Enterococcus faecium TaxID=1352 RepID=UPI0039C6F1A1
MVYYHPTKVVLECSKLSPKEFTGYLHCDGYSGYNAVESVRLVYCFAYFGGNFSKQFVGRKKHGYSAAQTVKQLDKWFCPEKKWKDFSPEAIKLSATRTASIIYCFYEWMATMNLLQKSRVGCSRSIIV